MREIKFRMYEKKNKRMRYDLLKDMADHCDYMGDISLRHIVHVMENGEDDELSVMQYTRALDKNGREVYEGDIVEYRPNEYWVVRERLFEIGIESLDGYFLMFQESGLDFEVVGNIYENPELLEGGQR